MAKQIAIKEKANEEIVSLAALLHYVDDIKIAPETQHNKANDRKFTLDNNLEEKTIELICDIISEVLNKGVDSTPAKTLNGRTVRDADRLVAIGAIGIARAFTYSGNHNRVIHDPK